jgi:hypothetical protein
MVESERLMPLTLCWSPPPTEGRTLIVVFAYHGRDRDAARASWLERLESAGSRDHRIVHRDHYANPRSFEYLVAITRSVIAKLAPTEPVDLMLDTRFNAGDAIDRRWFRRVVLADPNQESNWTPAMFGAATSDYNNVVLIYADALGLGCSAGEGFALRGRDSILIVNGRRRAFRMTRSTRRLVALNRVLAHSRVVERFFGVAVKPIAGALAMIDGWSSRS